MKKISKRETALLMVLFVVLCGFLYYNFYFKSFQDNLYTLNMDIDDAKQNLTTIRQENVALTTQKSSLENLEATAGGELTDVMSAYDQPEILYLLQNIASPLAEEYSVSFSPDYIDYGSSRVYSVTLNATMPSYDNLKTLLQALKDCPYVNRVVTGDLARVQVQQQATTPPVETTVTATETTGTTQGTTAGTTTETVQQPTPTPSPTQTPAPPVVSAHIVVEFYCLNEPLEAKEYPFLNKTFNNQNLLSGEPAQ